MTPQTQTRLIAVTKWPDYHPWPSIGGLRHLIFFAKDNGFDAVVRRIGRKCLIDEAQFFIWASQDIKTPVLETKKQKKSRREDTC